MRLGLLDVGSTAARLELVDLDRARMPRVIWSFKARTRLAENTGPDGVVSAEGISRAAEAVRACARAGQQRRPESIVAFGTSAVRDATNGADLRTQLSAAAGLRIGVLSPRLEAALTYHAAWRWHGRADTILTTVDIGGGTIDVASGTGRFPSEVVSVPIGAARLTNQYLLDDPPSAEQLTTMTNVIRRTLTHSLRPFVGAELGQPLALSKLLRQLAVLTSDRGAGMRVGRHPDRLDRHAVASWIPRLATLDRDQRAALPGVSRSRARRILAGAILADAILDIIGVTEVEICPWGLREGLVFRFVDAYESDRADAVRAAAAEMFA